MDKYNSDLDITSNKEYCDKAYNGKIETDIKNIKNIKNYYLEKKDFNNNFIEKHKGEIKNILTINKFFRDFYNWILVNKVIKKSFIFNTKIKVTRYVIKGCVNFDFLVHLLSCIYLIDNSIKNILIIKDQLNNFNDKIIYILKKLEKKD